MKSFNVALLVDIALYELFCELKVMGTMAIVHSVILGIFCYLCPSDCYTKEKSL